MPSTPRRNVSRRFAAVGLLLLTVPACTTFQPVAGDPVPGQRIRTGAAAEWVAPAATLADGPGGACYSESRNRRASSEVGNGQLSCRPNQR